METKAKGIFIIYWLVFASLLFVIFFNEKGLFDLKELKTDLGEAVRINDEMNEKNRKLYHEVFRLKKDPAYLEHVARHELGMVAKDEIVIRFHAGKNE